MSTSAFVEGVLMDDVDRRLQGAGETKKARWLTWQPGDDIDPDVVTALVTEGARIARMSRGERFERAMTMGDDPAA